MKIVIAPDSFKGCLTALGVAEAIERGLKKASGEIVVSIVPMADGGEGTVQSLVDATGGRIVNTNVKDPLFRNIESFYGILGDGTTAVIEMAAASGLPLLTPAERNPLNTSSYGTGELILNALDSGCRNFIIGLGGSATNDGGCGMAEALGVKFLDSTGIPFSVTGAGLSRLSRIDFDNIDPRIRACRFTAACDVDNPLTGKNGASAVFGPQKGASPVDVMLLDSNLANFAAIVTLQTGKDINNLPGAGAAGGLGAGVRIFLDADLKKGFGIVAEKTQLESKIREADVVITGEGMIDSQTCMGKTPFGVAQIAKSFNIPVIAIAGSLGEGYQSLYSQGFTAIYPIARRPMTLEQSMQNAVSLLEDASENIMRTILRFNKHL
jgi:glycerate kinase